MAATFDTLAHDALGLPPGQRIALARHLLSSVDPAPDPGVEAACEEEMVRRIKQADTGEITSVPAGEVFAYLRRIAPGRP